MKTAEALQCFSRKITCKKEARVIIIYSNANIFIFKDSCQNNRKYYEPADGIVKESVNTFLSTPKLVYKITACKAFYSIRLY